MNLEFLNKRQLDPAPPNDGAGLSLADLDNPIPTPPIAPLKKEEDIKAKAEEAAKEAALLAEQEAQKKEQEYNEILTKAVKDDGGLNPGYRLNAEGKVEVDPDYKAVEDAPEEEDNTVEVFFNKVNELRGEPLTVEYPEGVDPLSPEGVLVRDKEVAAEAVRKWEIYLKQRDARSYAYMLHRQNGGDDSTFLNEKTISLPSYNEFSQNADLQLQVYKAELVYKGLDEETAQLVVDKALKDNKLFERAENAYKEREARDKETLDKIQEKVQEAQLNYQKVVQSTTDKLNEHILKGVEMNVVIPEAEKKAFLSFVSQRMEYDEATNEVVLVERLSDTTINMARKLEALYLLYKKGDLKALIRREANVEKSKELKLRLQRSEVLQKQKAGGGGGFKPVDDTVPLGAL